MGCGDSYKRWGLPDSGNGICPCSGIRPHTSQGHGASGSKRRGKKRAAIRKIQHRYSGCEDTDKRKRNRAQALSEMAGKDSKAGCHEKAYRKASCYRAESARHFLSYSKGRNSSASGRIWNRKDHDSASAGKVV